MKKVRKWLLIVASSLVALALVVVGAFSWLSGSFESYKTAEYNSYPNYKLATTKKDLWGRHMFQRAGAPYWCEITFMGETYSGRYEYSDYPGYTPKPSDLYVNTSQGYSFHVNSSTREITGVMLGTSPDWYSNECQKEDVQNPEAYAISRAKEIAGQLVDLDQYVQIPVETSSVSELIDGQTYSFTTYFIKFARKLAGIETTDYIRVCITSKGTLQAVHLGEIGAFDNYKTEVLLKPKLDAHLLKTAYQAVQSVKNAQYRGYEVQSQVLTITPDGQFVVVSKLNISCYDPRMDLVHTGLLEVTTFLNE